MTGGSPPVHSGAIDILLLCTGNTCRSPMAAALLAARLAGGDPPVDARIHSAGMIPGGRPATDEGVAVMAGRGLDTSAHRSRRMTVDMLRGADVVVAMARTHLRDAVAACPEAWPRTFTLKELVRRGEQVGPRKDGQPLPEWLAAVHAGRRLAELVGESDADDVADPIGRPRRVYERTAAELDDLTARLARLLAGGGGSR